MIDPPVMTNSPIPERELRTARNLGVAASVRCFLVPGGPADPASVARRLGMSVRTLQRALASEGVTLSALVEEAKRNEACRLLVTTRDPLKEVARRVGYADVAAFCRAFRRWTGHTPRTFHARAVAPARTMSSNLATNSRGTGGLP